MAINILQKALKERKSANLPIINLSIADFTYPTSLFNKRKIQKAFNNIFKFPYYYPDAKGDIDARKAIQEYYLQNDQEVSLESLILTASISQSYLYLFKIFSTAGKQKSSNSIQIPEILVACPCPPLIQEIAGFLNIQLKYFELDQKNHWQIDIESLEKLINNNTQAIFLMSPNHPTGAIQTEETLNKLNKLLKGKNIPLIIDESLSEFVFEKEKIPIPSTIFDSNQLIISLQDFKYTFGLPGLKISWIQVSGPEKPAKIILKMLELLGDTFLSINQLSQTILPEIVEYSVNWRKNYLNIIKKNRKFLFRKLAKSRFIELYETKGGLFNLFKINLPDQKLNDLQFATNLLQETGVYLHPGTYYGKNNGIYLVICYLQDPDNLNKGVKRLLKYLKILNKNIDK